MRRLASNGDVGKESPPAVDGSAPETPAPVAARAEMGQEKEEAKGARTVSAESSPGAGRTPANRRTGQPRKPKKRLPRAKLASPRQLPGPTKKTRKKTSTAAASKRLWVGMF
jgi:hypothetical protein